MLDSIFTRTKLSEVYLLYGEFEFQSKTSLQLECSHWYPASRGKW